MNKYKCIMDLKYFVCINSGNLHSYTYISIITKIIFENKNNLWIFNTLSFF